MSRQLGVFALGPDYYSASPEDKRAACKALADLLRERAGLPPTDDEGKAPRAIA